MIKLKVRLQFPISEHGRTVPIYNSYRPLFKFGEMYVSGALATEEDTAIHPGEEATVEIFIHSDHLIGTIEKGQVISFWEPPVRIGDVTVLDVEEVSLRRENR